MGWILRAYLPAVLTLSIPILSIPILSLKTQPPQKPGPSCLGPRHACPATCHASEALKTVERRQTMSIAAATAKACGKPEQTKRLLSAAS